MGIDAGTSGIKAVIMDERGEIKASAHRECSIITPRPGWAEQNPKVWWDACCEVAKEASFRSGCGMEVAGIGFSGQMQGCVFLNKYGEVLENCLIWLDQRSTEFVSEINEKINVDRALDITGSYCLNSYWAPKLLWVKKYRPDIFEEIDTVLFPKDYLRFQMTGELATEVSDASLTFMLDVGKRTWAWELIDKIGIPRNILPWQLLESQDIAGYLREDIAQEWGMKPGIPVVAGGGDQPTGGVGMGIIEEGIIGSTIGTSGVIFGCTEKPFVDREKRAVMSMCHAVPDKWCFLGLALSSGGSFKWIRDNFFAEKKAELAAEGKNVYDYMTFLAASVWPGSEGLMFMPWLNGEKTPINDENARGVFFGLSYRHDLGALCRSTMEGIVYSLRETIEICRERNIDIKEVRAAGGGAKSPLWRQIQADVYNAPVVTMNIEESGCAAGAILASVGTGYFESVADACRSFLHVSTRTEPIPKNVEIYEEYFRIYQQMYPTLKENFSKQAKIVNKFLS